MFNRWWRPFGWREAFFAVEGGAMSQSEMFETADIVKGGQHVKPIYSRPGIVFKLSHLDLVCLTLLVLQLKNHSQKPFLKKERKMYALNTEATLLWIRLSAKGLKCKCKKSMVKCLVKSQTDTNLCIVSPNFNKIIISCLRPAGGNCL